MFVTTAVNLNTSEEISRLLCAAVVSKSFCKQLLASPDKAIRRGYQGESFSFSEQELRWISSIKANSLADFASQLAARPVVPGLPVQAGSVFAARVS